MLRNQINCRLRKESTAHNEKRVENAKSDAEIWKVVNEVVKPKKDNEWSIKTDSNCITSDPQEVADIFNNFFIKKVDDLKANIDKDFVSDPLEQMINEPIRDVHFNLKTVNQKQLNKALKKMKKKQSAGVDGLSQDKLVLGSKTLVYRLVKNQSPK